MSNLCYIREFSICSERYRLETEISFDEIPVTFDIDDDARSNRVAQKIDFLGGDFC